MGMIIALAKDDTKPLPNQNVLTRNGQDVLIGYIIFISKASNLMRFKKIDIDTEKRPM
jgi:hypothetical protein